MVAELESFFGDLDLSKLRVEKPSRFVFLCGGTIRADDSTTVDSLRDYLYRIRPLSKYLQGSIVRAEAANQLYRDTKLGYTDLISFEEDIARIAAVVVVIAESNGSLAELGAFASNETIRKALRVIIQTKHSTDESFIRYGPVERIKNDGDGYVGVYPWRTHSEGNIIVSSAHPHAKEIVKFIKRHLDAARKSEMFDVNSHKVYVIYWIVYICMAVSLRSLTTLVQKLVPGITEQAIINLLYCMKIAGWVDSEEYSGKKYYFVCWDKDPFLYSFKEGITDVDSVRRKYRSRAALAEAEDLPKHIRTVAMTRRAVP
ncbi:retron St85 family effector protein [Reyranella sp.]|uniref:retron St85 family effector protein n=1 Tax=Reyranella sp. TaxID=1929291 RepID=UPI003783748E